MGLRIGVDCNYTHAPGPGYNVVTIQILSPAMELLTQNLF